jgi:hypothetical protein
MCVKSNDLMHLPYISVVEFRKKTQIQAYLNVGDLANLYRPSCEWTTLMFEAVINFEKNF